MTEVSISKICIKIGEKEVELSPDEAKELQEILNDMFGKRETVYVPQPYPVYPNPYRYWSVTYGPGVVYCSTAGSNTNLNEVIVKEL
jgi:hypothetical protein